VWQNDGVNRVRSLIAAVPVLVALLVWKTVATGSAHGTAGAAAAVTFLVVAALTVTLWKRFQ
jgi:hypothetical protein